MRASAEPLDHAPGGVRRFILRRLKVPHEERGHEQRGREDEEQLRGGDGALDRVHKYFVMQSTCQVKADGPTDQSESVYCAAKWGARGYGEALKSEAKGTRARSGRAWWDEHTILARAAKTRRRYRSPSADQPNFKYFHAKQA